jgi:sulfide:quinone oxidoreductase
LVALGAETAPPLLDGFVGAPQAFDLYSEAGAEAAYTALKAVKRGKVLVAVAAMPFKCPPAPYEASMLVDALLRRQGVRLDVRLTLTTPEPHPLPVAPRAAGEQLLPILQEQRIEYVPNEKPERVRADRREVEYASGSTRTYDVLLVVPPHRAPAVVAAAGLSDASGWIPIDRRMKTQHGGIYACGDVAFLKLENGKPLPKAGVLAEGQARVAAQAIAAELAASGSTGVAAFDGEGECFIETGGGSAIEVRGSFFAKPDPRFVFGQAGPEALAAKERFEASRLQEWFGS